MTEENIAEINKLAKTKNVDEISKLLNIGRTTINKNACNGYAGRAKNIVYGYTWKYE